MRHDICVHPATISARANLQEDPASGGILPALQQSTTFRVGHGSGRTYGRADNPTFCVAENTLAALDKGEEALLFSSGMAAATNVFASLDCNAHVVAPRRMYWALRRWLVGQSKHAGRFSLDLVDTTNLAAVRQALRPNTQIVWLESPANPTWEVTDIAAIAQIVDESSTGVGGRAVRGKTRARLVVDATVATPVHLQPLELGADLVMHAATKALNGHSDVIAGVLVTKTADDSWAENKANRAALGCIAGSHEAHLLTRGLRTLFPRVLSASAHAHDLAERLNHLGRTTSRVEHVLYPGLPTSQGHAIAARQMSRGFGSMLSIQTGGGRERAMAVIDRLQLWVRATSLGGPESLVEHRASVEGASSGLPEDLLRLSVGLEDVDDLWRDLYDALQ